MRIRKTVSKLLGSAIVYPSRHSPPPSDLWAPSAIEASGLVCELNQSPWDVYPNLHLFNTNFPGLESSAISKKEEAEEETKGEETHKVISSNREGILVNSDKPIQLCQKPTSNSSKKKNEHRMKEDVTILCKKNDGKKWFCKRPAQLPNSLCEYHLSQSRSYYTTSKEKETSQLDINVACEPNNKRKQKLRENGGGSSSSSPYYYYNGFRPSSRRRRGGDNAMHAANEEERMDGCDDAPMAGLDEEDDEEVAGELVSSSNGEEKRVSKKRGRKPVKCRSLKSLL